MASNKNALIRYKTIDQCLRNRQRRWTLEDLIETCSDALYEYEGKDVYVSKRTLQLDIQTMRSDKLGYNAPIVVYGRKYYTYDDEEYSIMNIPVTQHDVKVMNDAIQVLRQFKDFSLFKEMDGVLQRLEDSVHASQAKGRSIIHLDKNEQLQGLEFIDPLYAAIQNKQVLDIYYQSFKAEQAKPMKIHPQLLKEFNNRWFVLAVRHGKLFTLALDRIKSIAIDERTTYIDRQIDGDQYYKDVVGVTVANIRPIRVQFWIDKDNAPYVKTKPFHPTQRIIEEKEEGTIFNIFVKPNFELERLILGFGNSIEVIKPKSFRDRIAAKIRRAAGHYSD